MVVCTKCVQVSQSETCKFLHPSCTKTYNTFALHIIFVQLGCTQYETHEFLREHVQRKSVAQKRATLLLCTCMELARSLHGACTQTCSIGHPPHSSASPVELRLRVGPRALSEKKRSQVTGGEEICPSVLLSVTLQRGRSLG